MSVARLRTVKLLSEITEDYFYLENLIEKLGMNTATDSKALKNTLEQASIFFNVDMETLLPNVKHICLKNSG